MGPTLDGVPQTHVNWNTGNIRLPIRWMGKKKIVGLMCPNCWELGGWLRQTVKSVHIHCVKSDARTI